ncbi:unnamed protein product [Agarophyton chilense]
MARNSPSELVSVEHLVGPVKGRKVTEFKLQQSFEDKLEVPSDYVESDALLGARFPNYGHFVLVFGGNHRLAVSERVVGLDLLPVKLVNLQGIEDYGESITPEKHGKLITLAIELTENRPTPFGIMEQVRTYDDLKTIWTEGELRRQEAANTVRGRRPKKMTHQKLLDMYRSEGVTLGVEGISFMAKLSGSDRTCSHYMAGADRLIETGELDFLCLLEGEGIGKFSKANLNRLRLWSIKDIQRLVNEWKEEYYKGYLTKAAFAREEENQQVKSGKKQVVSSSHAIFIEHPSWKEKKMNEEELNDIYSEVQNKVQVELQHLANKKEQLSKLQLEQRKLEDIVKNAKRSEMARGRKEDKFNLQKLMDEVKSGPVVIQAEGGRMSLSGILLQEDLDSIRNLSWATDNVFFFCTNFIINCCSIESFPTIMDSLALLRWFSNGNLENDPKLLQKLRHMVSRNDNRKVDRYECVWNKDVVVLPIVCEKHWSIAFVVNLSIVKRSFEAEKPSHLPGKAKQKKSTVFWLDSMPNSPHSTLIENLCHFLAACYRGKRDMCKDDLTKYLDIHRIIPEYQKSNECGFYSLYYLSLLLKNTSVFLSGNFETVQSYLYEHTDGRSGIYTYNTFTSELQNRVEHLRKNYILMNFNPVPILPFLWHTWEKEQTRISDDNQSEILNTVVMETSKATTDTEEVKMQGNPALRKRSRAQVRDRNASSIVRLISELSSAVSDEEDKEQWGNVLEQVKSLQSKKRKIV